MLDMLYEAAIVAPSLRVLPRAVVLAHPSNARYIEGWGRAGDAGVIADDGGALLGAAWYRLFDASERGDGVVAHPGVPEICIAVREDARGRGIGGALLAALLERAAADGFARLVLSVDPTNRARHLYERAGFAVIDADRAHAGTSLIMQATTR